MLRQVNGDAAVVLEPGELDSSDIRKHRGPVGVGVSETDHSLSQHMYGRLKRSSLTRRHSGMYAATSARSTSTLSTFLPSCGKRS